MIIKKILFKKRGASELLMLSPLLFLLMMFSAQIIQEELVKYDKQKIDLEFSEYYFTSFKSHNEVVILVNKKPIDVSIYCFNKNFSQWVKKDLVFYPNAVGYKAETKDKDCLNKIKIEKNNEILYYKEY